jgi:hypothetical protein
VSASKFNFPACRVQESVSLISVTGAGAAATIVPNAGCVRYDLAVQPVIPRFALHAKVTNDETAPGASDTVIVYYAFSNDVITDLAATGAPTQFEGNGETGLTVALQNAIAAVQRHATGILEARGRYLYVWYDITALAADASVSIAVDLVWLG